MSTRKKRDLKIYLVSAFVIYILIVLYITIFNRMPEEKRVDMELFRSYRLLINDKNYFYLYQISCNILMTIPFGILLPAFAKKFRKFLSLLLAGFLFSFLIECAQYFTGRGLFEMDDLFNNTVGSIFGFFIFSFFYRMIFHRKPQ